VAEFDRTIGISHCVETSESDEIVYAIREKRREYMRFVKDRKCEETSKMTVIIKKIPSGWKVISAWFGIPAPVIPGDRNMKDEAVSRNFWMTHALVWGTQPVYDHSVQTACPW
jgi:hypothetical protein